ncbi:MAG: hypothetical protein H6812_05930 [Phycisphaeraceae bacterium]|nr:hypothetical protein [Phycisphaerales bacterium]MCB9842783.1 hypothetical protein [Phycisphaeraceae bacterium]
MNRVGTSFTSVAMVSIGCAASANVTFIDHDFLAANWTDGFASVDGNGGSYTAGQQGGVGNPGDYYDVFHMLADAPAMENSGIAVFHDCTFMVYDPSIDGAIAWVDVAVDLRKFSTFSTQVRVAAYQNGALYVNSNAITGSSITNNWGTQTRLIEGAESWSLVLPELELDSSSHPDFSASGSPISFGFYTANSTGVGFGGYNSTVGVDNFRVTVIPACPGDVTGAGGTPDGMVDVDDLNAILSAWGTTVGIGSPLDLANDDGVIDVDDLNAILSNWGHDCR